jgi:hypothetical protein
MGDLRNNRPRPLALAVVAAMGVLFGLALFFAAEGLTVFTGSGRAVMNIAAILVFVLLVGVAARSNAIATSAFPAMFVALAALAPGAVAVTTVVAYLTPTARGMALPFGVFVAAALWVAVAFMLRRFATARLANARIANELRERLVDLQAQHATTCVRKPGGAQARTIACIDAAKHIGALVNALGNSESDGSAGVSWVTGHGYMDLWARVHRAEEALLRVAPTELVRAEGLRDRLRLAESTVGNRKELLAVLDRVAPLAPPPMSYDDGARAELALVRQEVNDYRDSRRDGIVRARGRLTRTLVFSGLTAYLLLVLAILCAVEPRMMAVASAYYLVAAVVGLFALLREEGKLDSAVEDYGLSATRMLHVPLVSGLAGVAGVVFIAAIPPVIAAVAGQAPDTESALLIRAVFDVEGIAGRLVTAAVFGLTPGLLIDSLHAQAERLKNDLKFSEATDGKPG